MKKSNPNLTTNSPEELGNMSGSLVVGFIVKATPYTRCYEVQLFGKIGMGYLLSSSSSLAGGQGTTEISSLLPGTQVLCLSARNSEIFILGVIPTEVIDTTHALTKFLTRATGSGIAESLQQEDFKTDIGIQNRSNGMPGDSVQGDWGSVNILGGGVILTQFMAALKAGETTGIWAYHFDKLLRLYGYNMEEFTAFTERVRFNDEGEAFDVEYAAKYPWEALGISEPGDAFTNDDSATWSNWQEGASANNYKNPVEPTKQDQTGLWRYQKLKGYLGDLSNEYVALPDDKYVSGNPIGYSDNNGVNYAGLLQILKGSDGAYSVKSAKEIIFSKYAVIPVPQQLAVPDHNTGGDWHDNYKASGKFGEGEYPEDQAAWDWGDEDSPSRASSLIDYLAYKFNFYTQANISEHKKDWYLPSEKEVIDSGILKVNRVTINPSDIIPLTTNFWANAPKSYEVDIDHRMKGVKYYEGMSCFSMLDDGSIIIEDAWGSQLIMSKGNITLSPAGDLMLRPGKGITAWAGKDIALRAANNIDITSSTQDVRLKAEGNLHVLAGNSGSYGGILLESRSDTSRQDYENKVGTDVRSSGVTVKCANSDFTVWAPDIFMSTRQIDTKKAGVLYLDADDGNSSLVVKAKDFIETIGQHHIINYDDSTNVTYFGKSACIISSSNFIVEGGGVFTGGGLFVDGTIGGKNVVYDGASVTMLAGVDGQISDAIDDVNVNVDNYKEILQNAVELIDENYRNVEGSVLNADIVKQVGFSLRTDKQYGLGDDFSIEASRWQQYLSAAGYSKKWKEPEVLPPGSTAPTFPHPGSKWTEDVFIPANTPVNFDFEAGHAKDRSEYESGPEFNLPESPESSYLIF